MTPDKNIELPNTGTRNAPRMHPLLHIPVPWVFALTYLVGAACQAVMPLPIRSANLLLISHIAGAALLLVGVALAVGSQILFRMARTTTVPFETASQLITRGPYRFSRNPMYISLTLIYLGEV